MTYQKNVTIAVNDGKLHVDGVKKVDRLVLAVSELTAKERKALVERAEKAAQGQQDTFAAITATLKARGEAAEAARKAVIEAEEAYAQANKALMESLAAQATSESTLKFAKECAALSQKTIKEILDRKDTEYHERAAKLVNVYGKFILGGARGGIIVEVTQRGGNELINRRGERVIREGAPNDFLNIRFVIKDLKIRDTQGTWLDFNFGNFSVNIASEGWSTYQTINVYVTPCGNNENREDYYHPHLNSETEKACLGNSGKELLAALNDRNYLAAVYIFLNTLTMYNPKSPYLELSHWVDNRDDGLTCACGEHAAGECPKVYCYDCGVECADTVQSCHRCVSCCNEHHTWDPSAAFLGEGLNKSGCTVTYV